MIKDVSNDTTADILRTKEETILDKSNRDKFSNLYALRYANYISNYTDYKTWTEFVQKATQDEFYDMEEWYMDDYLLRPYSKMFKSHIGDITNFPYESSILTRILKKIAYNDVVAFYDHIAQHRTLKKHCERLGL